MSTLVALDDLSICFFLVNIIWVCAFVFWVKRKYPKRDD